MVEDLFIGVGAALLALGCLGLAVRILRAVLGGGEASGEAR
jgi:hypothetical protein